jgi:hypothetical protein
MGKRSVRSEYDLCVGSHMLMTLAMSNLVGGSVLGLVSLMASVSLHCAACVFLVNQTFFRCWSIGPIAASTFTLDALNMGHDLKWFWLIAFTQVCVVGLNMLACMNHSALDFTDASYNVLA